MRRRFAQLLLTVVTAAVVWGIYAFHASHIANGSYSLAEPRRAISGAVFTVLLLASAYIFGLPDAVRRTRSAVRGSLVAPAATVAIVSLAQLAVGDAFLPRAVVFGSALIVPITNLLVTVPSVLSASASTVRAITLLNAAQNEELATTLKRVQPQRLTVVAALNAEDGFDADVLGAERLGERFDGAVDLIVVDDSVLRMPGVVRRLSDLHATGVRIRTLLDFYEEWFRMVPLSELEDVSLLFDVSELHSPTYVRVKRILDVVSALAMLAVLGVAMPFVFVGNAVGNRGPLLFTQPRIGKGDEEFHIIKLRTMDNGNSNGGSADWTQQSDPRVTRFGGLLRRLHIDELPQAINILRGDLSMVGPRPEQPHYVRGLRSSIEFYDARHIVRPGVTGWAQIALGYTSDHAGSQQKLQYDLYYIRNQSIGFDVRILIQTVRSSLRWGGR